MQDLHIAERHQEPLIAPEPPSDAVVLPADPSFPSKSIPAALRASRRTLAANLPFNINRSARRSTNPTRDPSPNPNQTSAELASPQSHSRGTAAPPAESPTAQTPSRGSRPVVAFRNYKQFLFSRVGEIQSAPPAAAPPPPAASLGDVSMPPPPLSFTHSNPLADPQSPYAPGAPQVHMHDVREVPDEPPQELTSRNHSRRPSAHSSEDEEKVKGDVTDTPDPVGGHLSELEIKGSSFAVGKLRSDSTMMALETVGSVMSTQPPNGSFDASMLPRSTREWRPRSERSSKRLVQGAAQRPGRHRYTYGNESIRSRQETPSEMSRSPSRPITAPAPASAPRTRMVRQASNVSLVSTGTPLELKGDYDSFMVTEVDDPRDGGEKPAGGVLSKLAPFDSTNVRPGAAYRLSPEPRSAAAPLSGSYSMARSLGPSESSQMRPEWQPRFKRSKSKLELGGERSDGSSFAYSFMYGIGSDREAAMQEALRESRKERERKRDERRERSESVMSRMTYDHISPKSGGDACAVRAGSLAPQSTRMSVADGGEIAELCMDEHSWDGEEGGDEEEVPRGEVDFGGIKLPVGPSFKQYRFPMGRDFRFSDGMAVLVPLEQRL